MVKITLLRHAPTMGNVLGQYIGRTDLPLCEEGIRLLRTLPQNPRVGTVYTSGMLRCVQTAQYLYPNARQTAVPALAEMDFGVFEGRGWRQMQADPAYAKWLDTGCEGPCPGGEDKDGFTRRCQAAFLHLLKEGLARGETDFHLVAHGGTIMSVLSALALPDKPYFDWKSNFCGGYALNIADKALKTARPLRVVAQIPGVFLKKQNA